MPPGAEPIIEVQGLSKVYRVAQKSPGLAGSLRSLFRRTLDDLKAPNLKVNFDPANMLLYDKGDPIRAVEVLGPDIRSVHVKDANRPTAPGQWGEEVPLGRGQVNIKQFVQTLKKVGYRGPLCIEREVGDQEQRLRDVAHGIRYLRECLAE